MPDRPAGKVPVSYTHLIQPTIIYDFPVAVSPLSKNKPDEPEWVERFEFYVGGFELGNAFSELNDPEEQRRRFEQQLAQRERGDSEAHAMAVPRSGDRDGDRHSHWDSAANKYHCRG